AQPIEREREADMGQGKATLARPRQEIGDVGVEPDVIATGGPQPERAIGALTRKQPVDRLANALLDRGVERKMGATREIVDVKEWQCAARDLLRAAEWIAVERRQERRRIERVGNADGERDAGAARHEVGEQIVGERQAFALGERLDRAARKTLRRGPHWQFVTAFQDKSA